MNDFPNAYEDPVRFELSAQIRTLLSSSASILDSVGNKRYKKPKANATISTNNNHNNHTTSLHSSSTPNLNGGSTLNNNYSQHHPSHISEYNTLPQEDSMVKPYDYLVQADAEAANYSFNDRPLSTEKSHRQQRPPSATTISRVTKHMTRKHKHHNSAILNVHDRQHHGDMHERDASVATTTGVRPNALFQHYEKTRKARNKRMASKIKKEAKLRGQTLSMNLSTGISMIRKQTLDERREHNRHVQRNKIKMEVSELKLQRNDIKRKMKTSHILQKKDSLALFEKSRRNIRNELKKRSENEKLELGLRSMSRSVLKKTSQPGFELYETTNSKGRSSIVYVPRTGKRSNTGSRVLTHDLPELGKSIICVDGSTLFDDDFTTNAHTVEPRPNTLSPNTKRSMGWSQGSDRNNSLLNTSSSMHKFGGSIIDGDTSKMMEMRYIQEDGSSTVLDASVWRVTPQNGSHDGTGSLGGSTGRWTGDGGSVVATTPEQRGHHQGRQQHQGHHGGQHGGHHGGQHGGQHGDGVAWENYSGIEYLMATGDSIGDSKRTSGRPLNSGGYLHSRKGPPETPPFGTGSGRSFTPQHDAVIGGLPPPWGVVAPHHATG